MGAKSPAAINLEYQLGFKEFVSTTQQPLPMPMPMPMPRLCSDSGSASCRLSAHAVSCRSLAAAERIFIMCGVCWGRMRTGLGWLISTSWSCR